MIVGNLIVKFTGGYTFTGNVKNEGINGFGKLKGPNGEIFEGFWKYGFLDSGDQRVAIVHGDEKKRNHRLCLVILEDKTFSYYFGKQKGLKTLLVTKECKIFTTTIYHKIYDLNETIFNVPENSNPIIVELKGDLAIYGVTSSSFRELDKISNSKINGQKYLRKVTLKDGDRTWIKEGIFSKESSRVHYLTILKGEEEIFKFEFRNPNHKNGRIINNGLK